jgi:hypothetical protein
MNFLKPDKAGVLKVLERIALHHPRSKQTGVLDILAEDYAKACQDMTMGQFEAAAMKANAEVKYFPVIAQIREAHERIKAEKMAPSEQGQHTEFAPMTDEEWQKNKETAKKWLTKIKENTGFEPRRMQ